MLAPSSGRTGGPGHLVWTPFRGHHLQAVVLRLSDAAPSFDTQEIIYLVWAQPVLTSAQIALPYGSTALMSLL